MWDVDIGVLELSDQDQPHVDEEVWDAVHLHNITEAGVVSDRAKNAKPYDQSNITNHDVLAFLWKEDGRVWVEVVRSRLVLSASDVEEKVGWPADQKHQHNTERDSRWSLHKIAELNESSL